MSRKHEPQKRLRTALRRVTVTTVALAMLVGISPGAGAAQNNAGTKATLPTTTAIAIGQRYNDRLDSRLSATSLRDAASASGYSTSTAYTGGRSADDAWNDGKRSNVFGLFGHANAGIFQTDEGATDDEDSILAAGIATDVIPYANIRFISEYQMFVDIDDMRLLILAGCYTANESDQSWGNFNTMAKSRGVDAIISFPDLVYFPATASGTSISNTNYSGNYFWNRFSYHSSNGAGESISTALSRASSDLKAKEGKAGGWDKYWIRGAISNPGAVKLKPAGTGQALDSRPTTSGYASFSSLTPTGTSTSLGPNGEILTEVTTSEGVLYRSRTDGSIFDAVGVPSRSGTITMSEAQARASATTFVTNNIAGFSPGWLLVDDQAISHEEGDAVHLLRWRTAAAGLPGSREVTVEIDRRTGAVVYLSNTGGSAATAAFTVTEAQAIAAARAEIGDTLSPATAEADTWNASRWIVTIDRGLTGRTGAEVPDVERIEIDAMSGAVLSHSTT